MCLPSGDTNGSFAPENVSAERLGTDGKSLALVEETSSPCTLKVFSQGRKPSLEIRTVYWPGSRLIVSSVAVVNLSFTYTWAEFGYEVAERRPVP